MAGERNDLRVHEGTAVTKLSQTPRDSTNKPEGGVAEELGAGPCQAKVSGQHHIT